MISFRDLSEADRRLLANSVFAYLKARDIPANWKELLSSPLQHGDVLRETPELLGAKR
ncbi:MAG: hypothetical protein V4555_17825 [Acidobacteriota bacterium]